MYSELRGNKQYLVYTFLGKRKKFYVAQKFDQEKIINHIIHETLTTLMKWDWWNQYEKMIQKEINIQKLMKKIIRQDLLTKLDVFYKQKKKFIRKQAKPILEYYDQQFLHDFVHHSNFIEGSRIPYDEVKKLMETGTSTYQVIQEIIEVKNSKAVWEYLEKDFRFSETHIKRLYHKLTSWLYMDTGKPYPRGRKKVNNIAWEQKTTPWEEVPEKMKQLLIRFKENKKTMFPLQLAFDFHYRFERIHPFRDWNGRVGRFLMNKILISKGLPPMIIFGENRRAYFNAIKKWWETMKKYYKFMNKQYEKSLKIIEMSYYK